QTVDDRFKEGKSINSDLTALGIVFRNRAQAAKAPGRSNRKLLQALRGHIGGHTRTTLVVTLSPDDKDFHASRQTLRFARDAQKVKVCPAGRRNERHRGVADEQIPMSEWRRLQQENQQLKRENAELLAASKATK
ncbi:unnamed protein product, partial [Scytosiphon promiscuus]